MVFVYYQVFVYNYVVVNVDYYYIDGVVYFYDKVDIFDHYYIYTPITLLIIKVVNNVNLYNILFLIRLFFSLKLRSTIK